MKAPTDLRVYDKVKYWNCVDRASAKMRQQNNGLLASWIFDFVSIHINQFDDSYGLCPPMCLRETGSSQTYWEHYKFDTKQKAIDFAKWVARQGHVFIVDCC